MRKIIAKLFRFLFKTSFFKVRFFGFHKRIFVPLNLFKNVTQQVTIKNNITLQLSVNDWIQKNIYFLGEYEQSELTLLEKTLNSNDVFIDLGANIGLYTLNAAHLIGENGTVICFEPFSKNFKTLNKNIALNNFSNITTENLAVGDSNGFLNIYYDDKELNLGMVSAHLTKYSHRENIEITTLDSYLETNPITTVNFIKIDIEGNEYQALTGMKKTLEKHHPKLLIEILENNEVSDIDNKEKIITFLKNYGYKKHYIDDSGNLSEINQNPNRMNYLFT